MSTKICPNCNAEVVDIAHICKHCMYDFHTPVVVKKSPLWTILWLAFGTALVSAMTFGYMASANKSQMSSIDQETKSIVFTTTYADHTDVQRVPFQNVSSVEYLKNAKPRAFQVDVLTVDGKRFLYASSNDPLDADARSIAETVGKPVVEKNNYEGPQTVFGKTVGQPQ